MKLFKSITVIILIVITTNAKSQTSCDSIQIQQVALDYIEGWFNKDDTRVDNAVHFEFVKRFITTRDNPDFKKSK